MWGTLLSLIPSIIGLFSSNKSHDEYTAELNKIKEEQRVSQSALQAKQLYAENATRGLPGYETIKEDIQTQQPTTLNEAKDWLTGGGVVDFLARSSAATNKQLRDLNTQNEQQKLANQQMYAQYLGGPMANQESQVLANRTQLGIGAANVGFQKDVKQQDFLNSLLGQAGVLGDMDWESIIAGLSGSGGSGSGGSVFGFASPSIESSLRNFAGNDPKKQELVDLMKRAKGGEVFSPTMQKYISDLFAKYPGAIPIGKW